MDPASALGMAAAIVDLLELGIKVGKRINEYAKASPGDTPKALENINTYLPLITRSLGQIKSQTKIAEFDNDTRAVLYGVVIGCLKLVQEMDRISDKIVVKQGEGTSIKLKKVIQSLKYEDKIQEIDKGLQAYIQVLILNQVVNKNDVKIQPSEEKDYFEVKEIMQSNLIERPELISKLHLGFSDAVRSLNQKPEFIVLHGRQGAGKTQLALQYCHRAFKLKHYQSIFWLQSASPTLLKLSLEHVASVIRQSNTGTTDEKLGYVKEYLAASWRPWLLVLDGYEHKAFDAEPLVDLVPDVGNGAVLVTTREERMTDLGAAIKVHTFLTPDEAEAVKQQVTTAIHQKDIDKIIDAMTNGLNVDSYSYNPWNKEGQPIINVAAEGGFDEAVQLFLDMGANPKLDKNQLSALGCAVFHRNASTVQICLDHEDRTGSALDDDAWKHITRYAISKGDTKIMEMLLERRGDRIDVESNWPREGVQEAAKDGNLELLRLLHSHGKFPQSKYGKAAALTAAISQNQLETVKFLLDECHADPNEPGHDGWTPLCQATDSYVRNVDAEGRNVLIDLLIKAGADVNLASRSKRTPLHRAAIGKMVPAVQLLLKRGADASIEDDSRHDALQHAASAANREEKPILALADAMIADADARRKYFTDGLFTAIRLGWRELALRLLEKADINALEEESGDTPLISAIKHGQPPMARMLVRKGANQNLADAKGKSPLLLAAEKGIDALVKELARARDWPGLEVGDPQKRTPLMLAAQKGHEDTVKILLGLGADKDAMDMFGDTALDVAEEARHQKVIALLEA